MNDYLKFLESKNPQNNFRKSTTFSLFWSWAKMDSLVEDPYIPEDLGLNEDTDTLKMHC